MSATLFDSPRSGASLSADGRYRWWLSRTWGHGQWATFVMLNPSIADAESDDPTIRRCVGFAKAWGMAGLLVVNLYALRSTDPKGLWRVDDPVGPANDNALQTAAEDAALHRTPVVAAWGANAKPDRVARVLAIPEMDRLTALGVTKDGAPKHPLARGLHRIPDDTVPTPWPAVPLRPSEVTA